MASSLPDLDALKARMRSTWMDGDYGKLAEHSAHWAEEFISRLSLTPGMRVLDVACGTGNFTLCAARRGAVVTGIDIAPNLLEHARARAQQEGANIHFDEGDAEDLPYPNASFDLVVSMIGAMFAPRPEKVAAELIRVCRTGGQIAMANWAGEGFVGHMFRTSARHVPPPPGVPSPLAWGDETTARERFRDGISDLRMTRRIFVTAFPFAEAEVVEFFRTYFGPTKRAFEALDANKQAHLREDLESLWKQYNQATDGTTRVEAEYLEVIATRS